MNRPKLHALVWLLLSLALTTACSSTYRSFRPAEKTLTETPGGTLAAIYDLQVGNERWGDIRVWSNGAEIREVDGKKQTFVHIGFETRNATPGPLALDLAHSQLEGINAGAAPVGPFAPTTTIGEPQTPAHTVGHLDFEFALPEAVTPDNLESFRIHWWLHGPDEQAYEQYTSFIPYRVYNYYRRSFWYSPWWGPYSFYWCAPPP